jgi:hypothetical protein
MEFMLIVFLIIGCSFAAAAIINNNYPQSYQASNSVWYRSSGGASGRRQQRPPLRTLASSNHHKWQNDHHNNDHHHSMLLASQKLRSLTMKALYHHDNDVDDIVEGPTRRPLIAGITTTEGRYREWEIMQQNHHGKQAFAPPLLPLWAIEDYWALSAYRKLLVFAPFIVDRSKYGREAYVCLAKEWPYNCAAVPFKWSSSRGAFEIRSLHLYQATNKLLLPMECRCC